MATKAAHEIHNPGVTPGPMQADGTYLYQLDVTPGNLGGNLWGGAIHAQNCNDAVHVEKAVKLFLAAEDLLAALIAARDAWGDTEFPSNMVNAAIAKAML